MEYTTFSLNNCERSIISYPETKIPEWFTIKSSTTEDSIIVKVASDLDYLLGFAFCFVIPQFSSEEMHRSHSTSLCYYGKDFCMEGPSGWHYSMTDLNLDKVFLWYDPLYCEYILEQLGRKRGKNMEGSSNIPELTFEFKFGDCLIKECGVRPIYASEYNDFLQQMNLKLKLRTKTRRYRDTDDEEQLTPSKKLKDSSIVEPVLEELATKSMAFQNIDELLIALPKLKLEALDSALPK
ncbi:disease resistance protein RML1A-like [Senna tora]|uniref:Disease resistance protein RML1A-like n=1 Tax=Senna tora TaxID=362788 RepID=A0A834XHU9_9FABA|nr:disease resistance protein RML1A-like [Senna tora]